jgi:putative membrane protein
MSDYSIFPVINATLNGTSALLIAGGVALVRRGYRHAHRWVMIAAVITSSLFLISYLYYHIHVGSVRFPAHGWPRPLYFSILISHTLLAAAVVPLVIVTLSRGLRGHIARHRASARWTYPVWMYVSVTGVVIYFMLYQIFGAHPLLANLR